MPMPITRSRTSIRRGRDPEFPTEEELEQVYNHARLTLCSRGYNLPEEFARELYNPSINDINDINNIQALEEIIICKFLKVIEKNQKSLQMDIDERTNGVRRNNENNDEDDNSNQGRRRRRIRRSRRNYRNYVIRYDNLNKREIIIIDDDRDGDDTDDDVPPIRHNTTTFPNISPNESIVVSVLIESHNNDIYENREIKRFNWTKCIILILFIFLGIFFFQHFTFL
ncbi:hypothetical protein C1645_750727, partial [Glomus cerebriforme]